MNVINREGYLRTSSEIYSVEENDIDNKFVHLTNDAVQKYSDKYGQAEQGNKLSYDEFQVLNPIISQKTYKLIYV